MTKTEKFFFRRIYTSPGNCEVSRGFFLLYGSVVLGRAASVAAAFGVAASRGAAAVAAIVAAVVAVAVNVALVVAGHLLHHLSVAVVASDVDRGVGELLLDFHARGEDHSAGGDEGGAHQVYLLHRVAPHAKSHGAESWHSHGVALGGPRLDYLAQGVPSGVDGALADSAAQGGLLYYLRLGELAVELCLEHVGVLGLGLVKRYVAFDCLYFDTHNA